jgi:hypothetical protein
MPLWFLGRHSLLFIVPLLHYVRSVVAERKLHDGQVMVSLSLLSAGGVGMASWIPHLILIEDGYLPKFHPRLRWTGPPTGVRSHRRKGRGHEHVHRRSRRDPRARLRERGIKATIPERDDQIAYVARLGSVKASHRSRLNI